MRAVTIAAAGAAVITGVSASSHVKHMHAKLHNVARNTWVDWNATAESTTTTTSKTPVNAATTSSLTTTTSSSFLWEDWSSTTSVAVDPATTSSSSTTTEHTWADWTSSSSASTPVEDVSISTETWGDWETSSSAPVDPTATSTETWGDWEATSSAPVDPTATSSETWGDWESSVPVEPTTTITDKSTITETTWADWASTSPVNPVSTETTTWGDWSSEEQTTTITLASTLTTTKYVEPVAATESSTWADWTSSSESVAAASTSSWAIPVAAESTGSCVMSIITSYGAPTWHPTPVYATNTTSSSTTTSSETWAEWTTSSTTPAAAVTTTSTSTYESWLDWTSSTVATEIAETTSTETWAWPATESESWTATEGWTATGSWGYGSTASASASSSSSSGWGSGSGSGSSGGSGSSSGGSGSISANGDSWGMTYSPYTAQGGCKDAGTVSSDLAVIAQKGFSSVRVYSTDCNTLENIGSSARQYGLKLILGVWISSTGISGAQGQVTDIVSWAQWDLVELIVVGNECVFNGYASASELAGFISSSASSFKNAGYTGLVTTTEPLSVWEDSSSASAFCSVVDVVGANLYAFFNADITADKAGSFIQSEINILDSVCSGKPVYVLESGWPHAGNCNGVACPSPENQATALKGIQSTAGAQVVFLSFEDEPWKAPGQFGVEQYWGCASVF